MPVISRIESIGVGGWEGGGRVGGGWAGGRGVGGRRERVGSRRRAKATIWTQAALLCLQYGTQAGRIHKGGQDCCEEQPGTPCSPINALQGHEMDPGGLTASVKSRL